MKPLPFIAVLSLTLAACSSEPAAPAASAPQIEGTPSANAATPAPVAPGRPQAVEVPARFHGLYAPDARACAEDYSYSPAFQNVTVNARDVSFFETGGPVTAVDVSEAAIAITLRETVGDSEVSRTIYLALVDDKTARYRSSASEPVTLYVRCSTQ